MQKEEDGSVRELIDQAMFEQGIVVQSPCTSQGSNSMLFMSEDELIELLEEVEAEMERAENTQLEELLEVERNAMIYLEEQIADFESREHARNEGLGDSDEVLCPVCNEAYLLRNSSGGIACPNSMNGSCSLRLDYQQDLDLNKLRDILCLACEEHASCCSRTLAFHATTEQLTATCKECLLRLSLL